MDDVLVGGGGAAVVFGSASPSHVFLADPNFDGYRVTSPTDSRLAGAGDFNGDGTPDAALGDPTAQGTGAAWLVYGKEDTSTVDAANLAGHQGMTFSGSVLADETGAVVDGIDDFTGDRFLDTAVAAPGADNNGRSNSGSVYVLRGEEPRSSPAPLGATAQDAGTSALGTSWHQGMNFTAYDEDQLDLTTGVKALRELAGFPVQKRRTSTARVRAATGVTSLALVPTVFMTSTQSSEIITSRKRTVKTSSIRRRLGDWKFSSKFRPRRRSGTGTAQIVSSELRTVLKPHIDVDGALRQDINPPHTAGNSPRQRWWDRYKQIIQAYATEALKADLDILVIGTELDKMTANADPARSAVDNQNWRDLIQDLRAKQPVTIERGPERGEQKSFSAGTSEVPPAKLTYAANWPIVEDQTIDRWNNPDTGETFFKQLDYVGVDAYFPLTERLGERRAATLRAGWELAGGPLDKVRRLHDQSGKPAIFTELGYQDRRGASKYPYNAESPTGGQNTTEDNASRAIDRSMQTALYRAAFQVWEDEPWFHGIYWWDYEANPETQSGSSQFGTGRAQPGRYSPRGKPARSELCGFHRFCP